MTAHNETIALPHGDPPARRLIKTIARFLRNRRQYCDLETFSDHMLRDIGLTRSDVAHAKRANRLF